MIKLKHFKPYEFVDKAIYKKRGDKAVEMMDREILLAIDSLHDLLSENYGTRVTIEVNTWFWGGIEDGRGYRTAEHPEYSNTSQHKGSAIDFKVKVNGSYVSATEINEFIIENRSHPTLKCISFIEMGETWTHIDARPTEDFELICWYRNGSPTEVYKRD